jgi:hypothetical protein
MSARFSYRTRQSAKLVEPGESSFDNPAPFSQSAAVFCISLCQEGSDPVPPQTVPDCLGIVSAIAYQGWDADVAARTEQLSTTARDQSILP